MSMTGSMCISMTGRPTRQQIANEQKRQSYSYYQVAKATKNLTVRNDKEKSDDWKNGKGGLNYANRNKTRFEVHIL